MNAENVNTENVVPAAGVESQIYLSIPVMESFTLGIGLRHFKSHKCWSLGLTCRHIPASMEPAMSGSGTNHLVRTAFLSDEQSVFSDYAPV